MDFKTLNGISIQEAFIKFHNDNPHIYIKFKYLAFSAINKGKKKLSAKMIVNVIRWEHFLSTEDSSDKRYRINDAYHAHYARKFMKDHSSHEGIFELRRLRAKS